MRLIFAGHALWASITLFCMPVRTKEVTIYFYVLSPCAPIGEQMTFAPGRYPRNDVFDRIRLLDPAAEDYRLKENIFGGETFCLLHEDGPEPLLGVYYKDKLARPMTEFKGELNILDLRDGEAIVDASYAAFLPGDVVALFRTSAKAPGFAKLAQWLSIYGRYACSLHALPDPNTTLQLDAKPKRLKALVVKARRSAFASLDESSPSVAEALRSASKVSSAIGEVEVTLTAKTRDRIEQEQWSQDIRSRAVELLDSIPELDKAQVLLKGLRRPIDLKRASITGAATVLLDGSKRVGPKEAADAMFEAYEQQRDTIRLALRSHREKVREAVSNTG